MSAPVSVIDDGLTLCLGCLGMHPLAALGLAFLLVVVWVGTTMSLLWGLDRHERNASKRAPKTADRLPASSPSPKSLKK